MSSFINSAKHFNSVENYLTEHLLDNRDFYLPYSLREICPAWHTYRSHYNRNKVCAEVKNVFNTLKELQVLCVTLQYKHHYEGCLDREIKEQTEIVKEQTDIKPLNILDCYSALKCISYQIEEEHLEDLRDLTQDERDALLFLERMIVAVADTIVTSSKAYDNAVWSID